VGAITSTLIRWLARLYQKGNPWTEGKGSLSPAQAVMRAPGPTNAYTRLHYKGRIRKARGSTGRHAAVFAGLVRRKLSPPQQPQ